MGYIDLIPDVFRLTMPDLATGKSYHTQKFNVGNKQCIGVTVKASQALSVAVAYGIATDTAAAAGVDIAASLPYKTSATSFASNTSTEGGTYHEIAVPPHARQAQLVISNASGSTVSGAVIDAALRVVAYPAASGSGSSDFASITGWPGSSSQFVHADGSYSPLSGPDITAAGGALDSDLDALAATVATNTSNIASNTSAIAGKQAAITGSTSGTKFARDTGAWSAIADGDLPATSNDAAVSGKIAKSLVDAKGDILVGTADNTVARLAVGTNDYVLIADSSQAGGMKWGPIPTPSYKGISCGKTSDQSVSGDTATDITFTTEIISETSDLAHSTSSNPAEITCNTTQNYNIKGTVVFAANSTGSYFTEYVSVLVGGTEKHRVPFMGSKPGITQPHHFAIDIDLPVTAAQVVKLQMYSSVNAGNVLGQVGGANQTILAIKPLGA